MKAILFTVLVLAHVAAQTIARPPSGPIPKMAAQTEQSRDYSTSCDTVALAEACKSYNDLVTSKDPDIMHLLKSGDAYVCFRENADVFNIISIDTPPASSFKKTPQSPFYLSGRTSFIVFHRFKKGQDDESDLLMGQWTKTFSDSSPYFSSTPNTNPSIEVSDSDISFFDKYKNVAGGETKYTLHLRRSTMRMSETFQWKSPEKDAKVEPDRGEDTSEGRSIHFD